MDCAGTRLFECVALFVGLTFISILANCVEPPRLASIGSVQLMNTDITEGMFIKSCFRPDAAYVGQLWIPFHGFQYLRFEIDSLSEGLRCDFEYKSAADGMLHSANVLVWEGVQRNRSADVVTEMDLVKDFVWWVQRDGFYRALFTNHQYQEFHFMAVWHKLDYGSEGASSIAPRSPSLASS